MSFQQRSKRPSTNADGIKTNLSSIAELKALPEGKIFSYSPRDINECRNGCLIMPSRYPPSAE